MNLDDHLTPLSSGMGKFNHIVELTGTDIYPSWRRAVKLALAGNGADPNDVTEFTSVMPTAVTPAQPMSAELTSMKDWVKEDAQAKAIIGRQLSPIVQNMLGKKLTAHQQWDALSKCFG
ncbi:uncharacterized protein EDB91DRAFT_1077651 [Suillus paluster]|uniref:uncharacterized protein n=1 Tax=Suillus paluster TaxID=48578 RepID=UPI001B87B436|nr:uncharacterized protein EDB91DRAFT_1077651 [Suillus paluster]KAG1753996.1 hypothetical protein EDB91DRAFT_1077651 [Suillus paluster]